MPGALYRKNRKREWKVKRNSKRTCAWKWRYPNILLAIKALEYHRFNRNPMMFYLCERCDFIHIGHLGDEESFLMYGGYAENIRELQKGDL